MIEDFMLMANETVQRNTAHAKSRSYTGRMTSRTETAWRQR